MTPGHHAYVPLERVVWGDPAATAVAREAVRLKASRVMIVASGTLSRETDAISAIAGALGERYVGVFDRCGEHSPLESILACAEAARAVDPDLIVTVGGGSPIDTVKVVLLCLTHDIRTREGLLAIAGKSTSTPASVRQIVVPTTLSAGEYSNGAGGTDVRRQTKDMYLGPDLCARSVILDPAICRHTPAWLWLSTAIRSVDHAVESYCSTAPNVLVDAGALHALRLFDASLRRTAADETDLDARLQSQMAVWLAASSLGRVPMGASHGIGYVLGTVGGVPHGYTSCVMLPAVMRWNEPTTAARQHDIAVALGRPDDSAAHAVAALICDLGLPRTLGEVGIGEDRLELIAEKALANPVVRANPRPIREVADVMEILRLAI
jgi:alcohol dehydrogenase class IV